MCCTDAATLALHPEAGGPPERPAVDPAFVRVNADGTRAVDFLVPDMHCAACIAAVERAASAVPGVSRARANLTNRRLGVTLAPDGSPDAVLSALHAAGRTARPFDPGLAEEAKGGEGARELMRCMAVAGFASTNVMLLSVSVWSGADGSTRDLFHWMAATIAIPAVIYAGRPFFRSAWNALRHGRTNMDMPIAIGVIVATALSLYETMHSGRHAWFDGSIALLFFLLVGRVLDGRMRDVARGAAARLLTLSPTTACQVAADGTERLVHTRSLAPGDLVRVLPGERVAVDGIVLEGASDCDRSALSGESLPEPVAVGGIVHAGTMNLTGRLLVRVTAAAGETVLAGIVRLTEAVERPDGRFVRLADRAARLYAPAVHLGAFLTLVGWLAAGFGLHAAVTAAVAVLIITCPCALGLAVPAVQVVAAGRLLSAGIILKDGAALEKLAEVDTIVLDKTGTLTEGRPRLAYGPERGDPAWGLAAALASASRHPLSRALSDAAKGVLPADIMDITERPGFGVEGVIDGETVRLGRPGWVGTASEGAAELTEVWLQKGRAAPVRFGFTDTLRRDARETVRAMRARGFDVRVLSGDGERAVARMAEEAGIAHSLAGRLPGGKVEALQALAREGRKILMVGDGLNDAPALAAAHVSMSPASGTDIAQAAAGVVWTGDTLAPVLQSLEAARLVRRKIFQNFALSIGYNVIAVPIAVLGYATPLIAAVSMSGSSILVIGNSLLLRLGRKRP
ncbi:MAG: cadmium-translocating P-type ATPase [Mesorhizobium amorphae]|nr:MAG: cadmium-translocating P-type ATPase [Mesorhizobium amorphae]